MNTFLRSAGLLASVLIFACQGETETDSGGIDTPTVESPWPDWIFQHWVWEDESTETSLMEMVDGYAAHDIPVGAVIIDSPWATGYNTFEWDTELFPDSDGLIEQLHARDIRVMLWVVPAINIEEEELYAHAAENQFFMQKDAESGPAVIDWWKGQGSLIDYFNPEAVEWWHGLMDPVLQQGIDGWKCDGLDFSSLTVNYSPGLGAEVERLDYSHAYYRDTFDYTREVLGEDRVNTARPIDNYGTGIGGDAVAFAPVDINWAGWVGDQDASFEGLVAALDNMLHSAEYGYVAFGSDIGGYREDGSELGRDKEVLLRWAQLGAFNPIMENGGSGAHWPWLFDDQTTEIYRTYVLLHHAILDYLDAEGALAFEAGVSLMDFGPGDTYDFLLGPDIFVAPMIESGTSRTVQLPDEGEWTWLFDSEVGGGAGESIVLEVPIEHFPVFVRDGSQVGEKLSQEL
jgi:alpha-glucosidase (family GH31 glycosyl hydrolase)